jgi:Family of unknown function (DUF6272)
MLAEKYKAFNALMDEQGIIFSFSGYLSEGVLYSLGEALRQKMTLEETDITTVKKVFSVFVEQSQNIIRYSADKVAGSADQGVELSSGMVTIGRENGHFCIVCANLMQQNRVEKLRERLELLRHMDKDEIKAFYREQLRDVPDEDSRGGTIGLIEIARRASTPIEFDFSPVNADTAFFCLRVLI